MGTQSPCDNQKRAGKVTEQRCKFLAGGSRWDRNAQLSRLVPARRLIDRGLSFSVCNVDATSCVSRLDPPAEGEGLKGRVPQRGRGGSSGRTWQLQAPSLDAAPSAGSRGGSGSGSPPGGAAREPVPTATGAATAA